MNLIVCSPRRITALLYVILFAVAAVAPFKASALDNSFTYQGILNDGVGPANGSYDFRFSVYDATTAGAMLGSSVIKTGAGVTNGLVTASLDFGASVFDGNSRWLEVAVRTHGGTDFTVLSPRQPITPSPYALFAPNAGLATSAMTAASASSVVNNAVGASTISPGQVVKSLNGLHDTVALAAGANVSLTTNGNTLIVSSAGGAASGGWSTTGNAGTKAGTNFIGTTDGQPLVLRANNVGINTNNPQAALHVNGTVLATHLAGDGAGVTNVTAATLSAPYVLKGLGSINDGAVVRGVAVSGQYAYLANGYDGLRIYNVSMPAQPVSLGHVALGSDATAVALAGHFACVACDGLYVVDVSNPTLPVITQAVDLTGYSYGVAANGLRVYLANYDQGFKIYDIASDGTPNRVGTIYTGGKIRGVAVNGVIAYLADEVGGLRVFNVSDPAKVVTLGQANDGGHAYGVAVSGAYCYLANYEDGVRIYDVSNAGHPVSIAHIYEGIRSLNVARFGNYLYVANEENGLWVYDVSDPRNPVSMGHIVSPGDGFAQSIAVDGNYVYLANEIGGLRTFFSGLLADVPGTVEASGFLGDAFRMTNLNASQLSGPLPAHIMSGLWQAGGNTGTRPDINFLGTIDNEPLELRAASNRVLRLESSGNVVIDPADTNWGNLVPGLTFGSDSTEGISSKRSSGGNQFGLDFYTSDRVRLSISKAGNVHIGTPGVSGIFDVDYDTHINANDIFLLGGTDINNGLGWYGDSKAFGPSQPDGPVLYGYHGGVLGTTVNDREESLTWDDQQVQVVKDLNVGGNANVSGNGNFSGDVKANTITANNTPGVNWSQGSGKTDTITIADGAGVKLATCESARNADGFLVIMGGANVSVDADPFFLELWDETDPANRVKLTSVSVGVSTPPLMPLPAQFTPSLQWVVPINANAAKRTYSLIGRALGVASASDRNLTVMYFPRQNN